MLFAIALLLASFLIIRGVSVAIRRFLGWLGSGKSLHQMADGTMAVEDQYAEDIRSFVAAIDAWKLEHTGWRRLAKGRPRLTREQRKAARRAVTKARETYLDMMHLSWYQVVIIFLIGSMLGLLLEEVWMFITAGLTQSRVGLVWGPFSPLYGFGAVFLTLICWKLRDKGASVPVVFVVSLVVGGTLEQITGWGMATLIHASSWSYLHLPDHITQWVAWRFLIMWGLLGLIWEKLIMPDLLFRIGIATRKRQVLFVALLAIYLASDIFMTVACFGRMQARADGLPATNAFERWIDAHYTNEFIAGRFQNLVINQRGSNE